MRSPCLDMHWWGEAPERRVISAGQNAFDVRYRGLRRLTAEPLGSPPAALSHLTNHFSLLTPRLPSQNPSKH